MSLALRRAGPAPVLALAAIVLAGWGGGCAPAPQAERAAAPRLRADHEIRDLVDSEGRSLGLTDTVALGRTWRVLAEFYEHRRYRPVWSNGRQLRGPARRLVDALQRLEESGLDPGDYPGEHLARLMAQADRTSAPARELRPRTLARFDVLATHACLLAADHIRHGRVPRAALDPDWARDSVAGGDDDAPKHWLGRDPAPRFARLEPRHEGYGRLRAALARYRGIAAAGGWAEIPPGPPLQLGARGPRVAALVRRLAASGDIDGAAPDTVFDRGLERAVGDVQARLGISRTGTVGEVTRAALNVPVERRVRQMELNLERWRWLPDTLGRRHVEVNIPAYRLSLVREGRIARELRIVVGRRESPTPVFSDRITYLEVNPTWTLPPSVVANEIAPALKRNRHYLEENHMRVFSIASAKRDTMDPREVPWKDAASDSFPYLVVQDAGPDNPLGTIKLMCPNEYDVYLHDTSQRSRFRESVRGYSHGCVRVEHAVELADSLLGTAPEDSVRLDSLVATGQWKRVRLPEGVPVHFLYWTAWADSAGRVHFRDDVYGLDTRLDAALGGRGTTEFVLNPDVAISPFWAAAEARKRGGTADAGGSARRRSPKR